MDPPETRYVQVGEADVAYQVFGDGPSDLLHAGALGAHIELFWEWPSFAEHLRRLASFSRVIFFDRRGSGLSDAVARNALPTWEEWAEDMTAVLDVAGSSRAAIFAPLDAGGPALVSPGTGDAERARFLATTQRASMTPRTAAAQFDYVARAGDVREALPLIQVPTLVLHVHENPVVPIAVCRD
jgi:pimeloyl-ACP methyl ester carboxylesterase